MKMTAAAFVVFCLLMASTWPQVESGFFDDLGNAVGQIGGMACAAVTTAVSSGSCAVEFNHAVDSALPQPSTSTDKSDFERDLQQMRGNLKYCCAVGALKSSIFTQVKKTCGEQAVAMSRDIGNKIAGLGQNDDACTGGEALYQPESPLCWPESGKNLNP